MTTEAIPAPAEGLEGELRALGTSKWAVAQKAYLKSELAFCRAGRRAF